MVGLGIGIAAWMWKPWESPVEYHKRKYLAAREHLGQRAPLWERTIGWLSDATGFDLRPNGQRHWEALDRHQGELIRLGFLERREFRFTHVPGTSGVVAVNRAADRVMPGARGRFAWMTGDVSPGSSNIISLTVPREDMAIWEELFRKADMP